MKLKIIVVCSTLAFLTALMVYYPPIRQALSAVKYSLDSGDTITDVNNPSFTGTAQIGKSGTAGYLRLYQTDTAGGTNEGTLYMDDSENLLKYYNGSSWLTVGIDYSNQSLVEKDDAVAGDYTGEESAWTNPCPVASENCSEDVYKDGRTGLYWSSSQGVADNNNFTIADCAFFTTEPRGGYDGLDSDCQDNPTGAINMCGVLSIDANDDGVDETDWYLPSQKELQQAYIDGMYNQAGSTFTTTIYFWSSTEGSDYSDGAWRVSLYNGFAYVYNKTRSSDYVRCVRRD